MIKTQTSHTDKDIKSKAQGSLLESLGAVSAAIAAMPEDSQPSAKSVSEQFMRSDAVLSMLYRSILDARSHLATIVAKYGFGDAMVDTLTYQLSALEAAYAQRLASLRKRREEQSRGNKPILVGEEARKHARAQRPIERKRNGTLWLLALLMLNDTGKNVRKTNGPRLSAA